MKSNEQEFTERLEKLDDLYERMKDELHNNLDLVRYSGPACDILQEMRDFCTTSLQKVHFIHEN